MARLSLLRLQFVALILALCILNVYGDTKRIARSPQFGGSYSQAQAASFGRGPYQAGYGSYGPGGYGAGRFGPGGYGHGGYGQGGYNRRGFGNGGGGGSISISKSISISRGGVSSSNAQSSAAGKK